MVRDDYLETLRPRIDEAVEALGALGLEEVARRGGLPIDAGSLSLRFLGKTYALSWPDLAARKADGGACGDDLRILVLDYLRHGDGSEPTGRWIGYQELPDGAFYRYAFQGYTGDQLVRDLRGDTARFRRAAESLGGRPLDMGDAGYRFMALPKIPLAVVWWAGDDEFPSNATVLFDGGASRYLPTDGLAILGRMLCRSLAKAAA